MRAAAWLIALSSLGCAVDETVAPAGTSAVLELELRDQATISILPAPDARAATFIVAPSASHGVLPSRMQAQGSIEPIPEAQATLYMARFVGEPIANGPCGDEPIAIALSLHRPGESDTVAGGLSAYCGEHWHGRPVRVLRLFGMLPR
jgi:hypothetical protein